MKALSVMQPWAFLIVNGYKPVENRQWATKYRGPLLIHASKAIDRDGYLWLLENQAKLGLNVLDVPSASQIDRMGMVGQVELYEVTAHDQESAERRAIPWFFGPYGFWMRNPRVMPFLPYSGSLGVFDAHVVV